MTEVDLALFGKLFPYRLLARRTFVVIAEATGINFRLVTAESL